MLIVHRAERSDLLAGMLGDLLATPLPDPMTPEIVSVPTRGVERWLTQQLAGRLGRRASRADGICANVELPFPGTLVRRVLAEVGGEEEEERRWAPERLAWQLLEVICTHLDAPWLTPFADHLHAAAGEGEERRLSSVRHLADLFDRYSVHRPDLLCSWARGEDGGIPPQAIWQAELWRRVRDHMGTTSPAELLAQRCEQLRHGAGELTLPDRVALFGLTRLPGSYLDVLGALGTSRDVHLFLLHPSPALWSRLEATGTAALPPAGRARRDDDSGGAVAHPLLASWGRDAREMQLVLATRSDGPGEHRSVEAAPATLLQRIQDDIRHDVAPPGPPLPGHDDVRMVLSPDDESVQVHSCHGRARQVEVARDAILHLFATAPDLQPREVILLCPDVEAFAPLVDAAFAPWAGDDDGVGSSLPRVPVRVADRSLRQTNPLADLATALLELASARVTASQVLDLAGRDPVRRRFALGDHDLRRLERWVADAGVRWGLDAGHRRPFKLESVEANTWAAGLDRLALGAAMAEEGARRFGDVLPLDDVSPGDLPLYGRLAELVHRVAEAVDALAEPKPLKAWCDALAAAIDDCGAVHEPDAWQRAQISRLLADLLEESSGPAGPSTVELTRGEVAELIGDRLGGRPTRANFRTGEVTLCTLVPMRSVPHRVVCLLGIDDGVFPRQGGRDGDDVLLADPLVGERDPRSEERQLLLDALMAATEHLIVTYSGRDERTNAERPPAVPVGELLEVVDATAVTAGGASATSTVVVHHPLQPFSPRTFAVGALRPGRPFGFDPTSFAGARALQAGPRAAPPYLAEPLPAALPTPELTTIELTDLEALLCQPVGMFLRQRLGYAPGDPDDMLDDALPLSLDPLTEWAIGERLLAAHLDGTAIAEAAEAERVRGALPPGALADAALQPIVATVETLAAGCEIHGPGQILGIDVTLPSGTRLVGAVADLHGQELRRCSYRRLSGHDRLRSWVRLLALSSADPAQPFSARTVGRVRPSEKKRPDQITIATVDPLGQDTAERRAVAEQYLEALVDLYRRGLCEPLPIYPKTSLAWVESARAGGDPTKAARSAWSSGYSSSGEDVDRRHQEVLGGAVGFDALLAEDPRPDETGEGWALGQRSRFGRYAWRLWEGLLDHEQLEDR